MLCFILLPVPFCKYIVNTNPDTSKGLVIKDTESVIVSVILYKVHNEELTNAYSMTMLILGLYNILLQHQHCDVHACCVMSSLGNS